MNELLIDEYVIVRVDSLAEDEEQSIIHKGMQSFEWTPGEDIHGELNEEPEHVLHIANEHKEENIEHILDIDDHSNEDVHSVPEFEIQQNDDEAIHEPINKEGLVRIQHDHMVSEEEDFVESFEDKDNEEPTTDEDTNVPVVVAALDDHTEDVNEGVMNRPRRSYAEVGVDRLHMCF